MRTATCFTPDRAFFAPAVRAIASLIEAEPDDGTMIYRLLEPTRAFALEQLHRSGEFREIWHCLALRCTFTYRLTVVPTCKARNSLHFGTNLR